MMKDWFRNIIGVIIFVIVGIFLYSVVIHNTFGADKMVLGNHYVKDGVQETGAQNIVTTIVVLYRGFDTLGEVTVLFLAATALGAILAGFRDKKKNKKKTRASLIVSITTKFLFPMIILFGSYIFIHGHLTPGGGFPGGVVIATAFLLMFLADPYAFVSEKKLSISEGTVGMLYVITGLVGLYLFQNFLESFLPTGSPGTLLSGGIIPVIYVLIGIKVGSELTGLLNNLREDENAI